MRKFITITHVWSDKKHPFKTGFLMAENTADAYTQADALDTKNTLLVIPEEKINQLIIDINKMKRRKV
jgi:hypothetical protein